MKAYIQNRPIYADLPQRNETEIYLDFNEWDNILDFIKIDLKFTTKPKNIGTYKSRFRAFCRFFKDIPFNRKNFNAFISEFVKNNYANNSINKHVSFGKILDKYYGLNQLLDYTYFAREEKKFKEILTPDEIMRLANTHTEYHYKEDELNERERVLILLLALTGCRIGEALDLKWSDLFADPTAVFFRQTKNGSNRLVPISEELYAQIKTLTPWNRTYIFSTYKGGRYDHADVLHMLKKRAKKAGIEKNVYPHLFRHSYVTTLLKAGVSTIIVARIVGHADVGTTQEYANLIVDDLIDAMQAHPLLKKSITFENLVKKMRRVTYQSCDPENFETTITESSTELTITIKKL